MSGSIQEALESKFGEFEALKRAAEAFVSTVFRQNPEAAFKALEFYPPSIVVEQSTLGPNGVILWTVQPSDSYNHTQMVENALLFLVKDGRLP
jgi:hypothetical protein